LPRKTNVTTSFPQVRLAANRPRLTNGSENFLARHTPQTEPQRSRSGLLPCEVIFKGAATPSRFRLAYTNLRNQDEED
jgi:hypothetical protein